MPYTRHTIMTGDGTMIDLTQPDRDARLLTPRFIASTLARICRFGGHLRDGVPHYSVAQHCLLVAYLLPAPLKLAGLMHDVAEAPLGCDVPRPLKLMCPDLRMIEHAWDAALTRRFGLPFPRDPMVKEADLVALVTERNLFQCLPTDDWFEDADGVLPAMNLPPRLAMAQPFDAVVGWFLAAFDAYGGAS